MQYKFIIFDLDTTEPVDVAKDLADAKNQMKDLPTGGNFAVKPFRKYSELLQKNDPKKYSRLTSLIEKSNLSSL